jgi:hypothetical protein
MGEGPAVVLDPEHALDMCRILAEVWLRLNQRCLSRVCPGEWGWAVGQMVSKAPV